MGISEYVNIRNGSLHSHDDIPASYVLSRSLRKETPESDKRYSLSVSRSEYRGSKGLIGVGHSGNIQTDLENKVLGTRVSKVLEYNSYMATVEDRSYRPSNRVNDRDGSNQDIGTLRQLEGLLGDFSAFLSGFSRRFVGVGLDPKHVQRPQSETNAEDPNNHQGPIGPT